MVGDDRVALDTKGSSTRNVTRALKLTLAKFEASRTDMSKKLKDRLRGYTM